VQARYHDGLTTAVHTLEVALADDAIGFRHGGAEQAGR
jgi:hypothetical protein